MPVEIKGNKKPAPADLDTCASLGQAPEIPCKRSFNVRVGHDLHLAASVAATKQSISLNDLTRKALSEYLGHHA